MEDKKLAWWDEFETERKNGRHAFLFTGAVGDGFPRENLTKDETVDTLDTWEELMVRRLGDYGKDNDLVLWTFDLVRGFRFPFPEHERKFRDLMNPPDDRAVKVARIRWQRPSNPWPIRSRCPANRRSQFRSCSPFSKLHNAWAWIRKNQRLAAWPFCPRWIRCAAQLLPALINPERAFHWRSCSLPAASLAGAQAT